MPQIRMKEDRGVVHVAGLGIFESQEFTDVSDQQIEAFESTGANVSDLFDVKSTPVEKKDTSAEKAAEKKGKE